MKHPDLINEFPDASDETKVRHFWKQLKKEDDLQLSLLSWISIFLAFILVLVALMYGATIDLHPFLAMFIVGGLCAVLLWRSWLWRSILKSWGLLKRNW